MNLKIIGLALSAWFLAVPAFGDATTEPAPTVTSVTPAAPAPVQQLVGERVVAQAVEDHEAGAGHCRCGLRIGLEGVRIGGRVRQDRRDLDVTTADLPGDVE